MMLDTYLAIDFGAGSGRVMAGFVSAGMVQRPQGRHPLHQQ